jgi:uncharacterized protein (DUF362 family)
MRVRLLFLAAGVLALSGCPKRAPPAPAEAETKPAATPTVDVTSSASVRGDAGPPVVAEGAVDGAALRARHRQRLSTDTSPVTVLQGGTPRELGRRICEASVPKRPPETPILIKPNLGGFEWFRDPEKSRGDDGVRGRITDPEFVRGIVQCLKARGHARITLAEGWGATHADWKRLVRVSGYEAMAREESVPLVAMDDDGAFDKEGDRPGLPLRVTGLEGSRVPTLLVPKILAEHLERGMFISAPKLKAHRFGVVSVGIKGMQGTVMRSDASPAFQQKWRMHKELRAALDLLPKDREAGKRAYLAALRVFAERMVDVLEVSAPDVVLAEGAPAMGGDGFGKRWPSAESVAVGGTNPVLVDRVSAALLGLWDNADLARELGGHRTSPLIEAAATRFGLDLSDVRTEGDGAVLLQAKRPVHFVSMSGFQLHSDDAAAEVAPAPAPAPEPAPGARPTVRAPKLTGAALAIDGAVDAAWARAAPVTFDTDWSGARTDTTTRARFFWSSEALYALFELENAGLFVDASRPVKTERDKLYEEDCVEIFLAPDPANRQRYAEIEVGPLGHFFDLLVDRGKKTSDVGWSSRPEIRTRVDPEAKRVTLEVALRAPEITSALRPGARLPLGLYRMEGKAPRTYLAWSPTRTPKPSFHVPEAFGWLVLEP